VQLVPSGTTWLDLVTFAIAVVGLVIGCVGVTLAVRRDRRESKAQVAIEAHPENDDLVVTFTNTSHRPLSITRAGFNARGDRSREPFTGWRSINLRTAGGRVVGDPSLPSPALQPGDPPYPVRSPLHRLKWRFLDAPPERAWCEDERGNVYEARLSEAVRQTIRETKRRVSRRDGGGGFSEVEIEDTDPAESEQMG
jgi:hypothetical protein